MPKIQRGNRSAGINACGETAAANFPYAFARNQCLVLADGSYEWDRIAEKKLSVKAYLLPTGTPVEFPNVRKWRQLYFGL